jgi:hypothetical protein
MNANKGDQDATNEAWDQVEKVVNGATELYLQELRTYLDWAQSARKGMLEQTLTAGQQLSRIGEAQYAFLAKMQEDLPLYGRLFRWTEWGNPPSGATEKRSGRTA